MPWPEKVAEAETPTTSPTSYRIPIARTGSPHGRGAAKLRKFSLQQKWPADGGPGSARRRARALGRGGEKRTRARKRISPQVLARAKAPPTSASTGSIWQDARVRAGRLRLGSGGKAATGSTQLSQAEGTRSAPHGLCRAVGAIFHATLCCLDAVPCNRWHGGRSRGRRPSQRCLASVRPIQAGGSSPERKGNAVRLPSS